MTVYYIISCDYFFPGTKHAKKLKVSNTADMITTHRKRCKNHIHRTCEDRWL